MDFKKSTRKFKVPSLIKIQTCRRSNSRKWKAKLIIFEQQDVPLPTERMTIKKMIKRRSDGQVEGRNAQQTAGGNVSSYSHYGE